MNLDSADVGQLSCSRRREAKPFDRDSGDRLRWCCRLRVVTLHDFVHDVSRQGGTYHRIDFGDGLVIDGEYDMQQYWPLYHFPEDLRGRSVLDVGTASGFFALECARRGAEVTAIDIWPGSFQRAVFDGASSAVRYIQKNLFDLDETFGQ